jgi:hypothetical protein
MGHSSPFVSTNNILKNKSHLHLQKKNLALLHSAPNQRPAFPCYSSCSVLSANLSHQSAFSSMIHIFIQEPTKNQLRTCSVTNTNSAVQLNWRAKIKYNKLANKQNTPKTHIGTQYINFRHSQFFMMYNRFVRWHLLPHIHCLLGFTQFTFSHPQIKISTPFQCLNKI